MTAWDISTSVFLNSKSVVTASTHATTGLYIRSDGLKMYVVNNSRINGSGIGSESNEIYEFNLSIAWDITTASFVQLFDVDANTSSPVGVFFRPDGTRMFIVKGDVGSTRIHQYNLSTPWNISTASFDITTIDLSSILSTPTDLFFRSDGLKAYISDAGNDSIHEFNLSSAWNITNPSLSFVQSKNINAQDTFSTGVFFKPDGLKMFVTGATNDRVYEYNLSTAWNVSTAVFFQSILVSAQDTAPSSVFFKPDGLKLFITGQTNGRVYSYDLIAPPSPPTDAWNFREHKTSTGVFNPVYTFQRESTAPNRFQMISGSVNNSLGHGYLFKTFPIESIIGSDIELIWSEISGYVSSIGLAVYDGIYDPASQVDFPDAIAVSANIIPKGGGLLGSTSASVSFGPHFGQSLILPASSINYANSVTGFVTVFFINADSQQLPYNNILFDSIDISTVAEYNFSNSQVTNVLTGTIRDWGFVNGGSIILHAVTICDDISTSIGWVKVGVNVNTRIFIDDPLYPDLIKLNLDGGGGSFPRYAYKDIGSVISGDVRLDFKLDYDAMGQIGFPAVISIGLCATTSHPQQQGTNGTIRVDLINVIGDSIAMNGIVNDATTTKTTSSGAKNQHSLWIYPNSNLPASDASLKGPYYVRVELKNNKLRLSTYKDSARTQHIRGSPITVDATGVNPTNLRYIMVGNNVASGGGRIFQGSIDDICVSQYVGNLPTIPQKFVPATGSFIETWDGYATGDQNPIPWISQNEVTGGTFTPLIDIHEVSPESPVEGTKAFKIDQLYTRTGSGSRTGRVSVSRFLPAIIRTDGSGLDIPLSLNAKMRADILSLQSNPVGVMVGYELILGTPNIPTSTRGILFKLYGTSGSQAYIWNGTEWIINNSSDVPISLSNPTGSVAEIEGVNLKDAFDSSAILSETNAWDFESHVTGMWIGYVGLNNTSSSTPTEVLIHGDTISMLNAGIEIETFSVGVITKGKKEIEFKMNAILIGRKEFTINAHLSPLPAQVSVNARIVRRTAVNNVTPSVILVLASAVTTDEPFFINAHIFQPSYKPFTINAKIIKRNQSTYLINAKLAKIRSFRIDAFVGVVGEPQSILDVESVIGHEV